MDEFKFSIGSYVKPLGTAELGDKSWLIADEWRYVVIERFTQQCYGGIQRHYLCRGVKKTGVCSDMYIKFVEVEIQQSRPFSDDPIDDPLTVVNKMSQAVKSAEEKIADGKQ